MPSASCVSDGGVPEPPAGRAEQEVPMKEAAPKIIVPIVLALLSVMVAVGMTLLVQRLRVAHPVEAEPVVSPEI